MGTTRYKPSKPVAVLGLLVGLGMLAFGLAQFRDADGGVSAFLLFWCLGVVGITAVNTWAAFSAKGSLGTFVTDEDDEPHARR
jgi:hypothetical protein